MKTFFEVSEKLPKTKSETFDYTDYLRLHRLVRNGFNLCNRIFNLLIRDFCIFRLFQKSLFMCAFLCFIIYSHAFGTEDIDTAKGLFLKNDTASAIKACENIISATNDKELISRAHYIIGLSLLKESRPADARAHFNIILNDPKDTALAGYAACGLVDSYFIEGNFQDAISGYRKVLLESDTAQFKNTLQFKIAKCLQKLGKWQEAKDLFNKIRAEYPLSFEAKLSEDALNENLFYFCIQVGAFGEQNRADKLCEKLRRKGFDAFISVSDKYGTSYYRVRVGRLNSLEEASALADKLKSEGYPVKIYP